MTNGKASKMHWTKVLAEEFGVTEKSFREAMTIIWWRVDGFVEFVLQNIDEIIETARRLEDE